MARIYRLTGKEWESEAPEFYEFAILLDGVHIGAVGRSLEF